MMVSISDNNGNALHGSTNDNGGDNNHVVLLMITLVIIMFMVLTTIILIVKNNGNYQCGELWFKACLSQASPTLLIFDWVLNYLLNVVHRNRRFCL